MSFVDLGGDESRPSYFEVKMADSLYPSLRAAIVYAVTVFSQQGSAWLHGLLDYQDEAIAGLILLLDAHSLSNADATFAESLYGLQRKPLDGDLNPRRRISSKQRIGGLAFYVSLFYMLSKADRMHERIRLDQGILRLALTATNASPSRSAWARHQALLSFYKGYPFLRSSVQSIHFGYQLLYLVGSSPVHSPLLHLMGMKMTRASAMDLNQMAKDKAESRSQLLARLLPPPSSSSVQSAASTISRSLLRAAFFISDHHQSALLFAVFGYKALEWWFYSAEGRLKAAVKSLPPPPPPPRPSPVPPSHGGIGLPSDPSHCPLCHKKRSNPTQIATSGYVLCYPCAFSYVSEHQRCPVTHFKTRVDHLRKIYEQKDERHEP